MKCTKLHETPVSQFPTSQKHLEGWHPMHKIMQYQAQKC